MHRVKLLATKAVKNVFEEQKVLNEDGTINLEELLKINWGTIYHQALKGAIGICEYTPDSLAALELAVPEIFDHIPRFKFDYPGKWMGANALSTIDSITDKVVEENNCLNSDGTLNVEAVRKVEDWATQYNNQLIGCLGRSGVGTAYKALERVFPSSFGWGKDQIHPGEIRYAGMWEGKGGKRLFQLRLAYSIYETFENLKEERNMDFQEHTVTFDHNSNYPLHMSKRDVQIFMKYLQDNNLDWRDYIAKQHLTAGLRDASSGSIEVAIKNLFGKEKGKNKKLGNTELSVEDLLLKRISKKRSALIDSLLSEITVEIRDSQFSINGFGKQDGYTAPGSLVLGIEGTCLAPLLQSKMLSEATVQQKVLYSAFSAAVLSFPATDGLPSQERHTVLEKILVSKTFPPADELILSISELRIFLKLLKEQIIPNTALSMEVKNKVSKAIDQLLELKVGLSSNVREVILQSCQAKRSSRINVLYVINKVCEQLFNSMAAYEIRIQKGGGSFSPIIKNLFNDVPEEDEI